MLKDWKHSGFSIESETRLFSKADREALGQYVVRGATCAEKIQYYPDTDTVIWTASAKGFYKGKSETFKGFEFVDQLVRRYGVYARKVRKKVRQLFKPPMHGSSGLGQIYPWVLENRPNQGLTAKTAWHYTSVCRRYRKNTEMRVPIINNIF